VESVSITGLPDTLTALEPTQLSASILPANCAGETVTWSATPGLEITSDGEVLGSHLGGPFTVTATVGGEQATAQTIVTVADVVADTRWALAWADDGDSADYEVDKGWAFSTGGAIRSGVWRPGDYTVRFPGLAAGPGQRQSVQVSAYGSGEPRRCLVYSVENDQADLVVKVACRDFSGAPAYSQFTILVVPAGSLPGRSAFAVSPTKAGDPVPAITAHNSAGRPIRIARTAQGLYAVTFEGLARTNFPSAGAETFHVTRYGSGLGWCKIGDSWESSPPGSEDLTLEVECYSKTGTPTDAQFSVLMVEQGRPSKRLGFVWAHGSAVANYTPNGSYSFNSTGGTNVISQPFAGIGSYEVSFSGLQRVAGQIAETVLVTAQGSSSTVYCQVDDWHSDDADVLCYDTAGNPANSRFTAIWIE
jgi:hypothetical protein